METFSLVRAVPGMRPGAKVRNAVLLAVSPALVLVWPFVAAYAVGTDRGGCAGALDAVPGIARGGGTIAAVAAFTWTALALALVLAPLALAEPTLLSRWLTLSVPALYLLAVGFAAAQTFSLFGAWWRLRQSAGGDVTRGPRPVHRDRDARRGDGRDAVLGDCGARVRQRPVRVHGGRGTGHDQRVGLGAAGAPGGVRLLRTRTR